ncbi:MAG: PorV/PorQ family protein [Bacteroidota bacterium]
MNRSLKSSMLLVALMMVLVPSSFAQVEEDFDQVDTEKIAQTGMKFLTTSLDARATALGGAVTADESYNTSTALFYNPAGMARMSGTFHVGFSNTAFIEDINYNAFSVAFQPQGGNYGVFGLSILSLDYGEIEQTIRADTDAGFVRLGTFSPTAMAIGLGYARSFTDRFSVGAHFKIATQDLGSQPESADAGATTNRDFKESTVAVDFGVLYNTGFRSLTIGMSARNFSQEVTYVTESFELPLTFQIGLAMDLVDFTSMDPNVHSIQFSVDAQRPRDFQEHVKAGAEYTFMDLLSLRAGIAEAFVQDQERGFSLGAGLNFNLSNINVTADYSYTDFGVFDGVNRFSLALGL